MDHLKGRVAVITGASAGIGAATAIKLVEAGLTVVGIARRLHRLQALKKMMEEKNFSGQFFVVTCDLTNETDILNAFKWIDENIGGIHFMVNNAGILRISKIIDGSTEHWHELIDCNVLAPAICSREAYKLMKKHNISHGHIIQINSITGHSYSINPGNKIYNASKQALRVLTEGLRHELAAAGDGHIKASSISPGFVDTEIFDAANMSHNKMKGSEILSAEEMADMICFVLSTGPNILVTTI
uniref:Dehydrogenase/reductase SDR family member 11 n=1 Tax=Melanaphis sacchari TaxID=742174 RepID=A0A2H8TUJ6_9HEMI